MSEVYRNHPSVLAYGAVTGLLLGWVARSFVEGYDEGSVYGFAAFLAVLAIAVIVSERWRERTTYEFTDSDVLVTSDLLVRRETRIRYSRLASVSAERDLICRLFGTERLEFNVNSGVDAQSAEASLVLAYDRAEALRADLSSKIFHRPEADASEQEPALRASATDVLIHSVLSQSSPWLLVSVASLAYAFYGALTDSSGVAVALFIFFLNQVVPSVMSALKYWNYSIGRSGSTITVSCGMLSKKTFSFDVSKVNYVRTRSPLVARAIGRCTLEAEVVGVGDSEGVPLLCPLKRRADVEALFRQMLPEFWAEGGAERQPGRALMASSPLFLATAAALVVAAPFAWDAIRSDGGYPDLAAPAAVAAILIAAALFAAYPFASQRVRSLMLGEDVFVSVSGGFDLSERYVPYDKVQTAAVAAGPLERRLGLARCRVSLLTSKGFARLSTGRYSPSEVGEIPSTVMGRISDGRYDWRRYRRKIPTVGRAPAVPCRRLPHILSRYSIAGPSYKWVC